MGGRAAQKKKREIFQADVSDAGRLQHKLLQIIHMTFVIHCRPGYYIATIKCTGILQQRSNAKHKNWRLRTSH